jgi:ABC-type multidrug transport system fused ATPase/permease subunit
MLHCLSPSPIITLKLGSRFSQDIQVADQEFSSAFLIVAINVLGILGTFVFIMMATPWVAVILPFLAVLGVYFVKFYLATSKVYLSPSDTIHISDRFSNSADSNPPRSLPYVSMLPFTCI